MSTPYTPDLWNWSLTTRCSFVSYPGHHIFRGSYHSAGDTDCIFLASVTGSCKFELYYKSTEVEMNLHLNCNFLQNSPVGILHVYSSKYSMCWITQESPFFLCNRISFNDPLVLKSNPLLPKQWVQSIFCCSSSVSTKIAGSGNE